MPILDIELVGVVPHEVRRGLAQRLANSAGEVMGSRPQGTWVKLRYIETSAYAENAGGPPENAEPVIVYVLQSELPQGTELAKLASELTAAIARVCSRPVENVHLIFEAAAAGRISFGGQLRT